MSIKYNGKTIAGNYKSQIIKEADTVNSGKIRIATQEEVDVGTNNTTAITPFYLLDNLNKKQDRLIAGEGIKIENDVISTESTKILTDNQTIVQNEDNTITAIGQKTKSDTIMINWEGTQEEYETGLADGSIDPEWYCYITDDEKTLDYNNFAQKEDIDLKANVDLDNLTETGEKHFLNYNQITNCLTEIPERIKYTLENGVLTLKAGSVIIVPYGTEAPTYSIGDFLQGEDNNNNFKIVDIQFEDNKLFYWCEVQADISQTTTGANSFKRYISVNIAPPKDTIFNLPWNKLTTSATSLPDNTNSYTWYQVDNNKVVHVTPTASPVIDYPTLSLPILRLQGDGSTTDFATVLQVFNGIGNVGGINWVDKGVKGFIPNYRNQDRTLKSIAFTQTKLTFSLNRSNVNGNNPNNILVGNYNQETGNITPYQILGNNYFFESDFKPVSTVQYQIWYDTYENIYKFSDDNGNTWEDKFYINLGQQNIISGVVTCDYNAPFQALNTGDNHKILNWSFPSNRYLELIPAASGTIYTAPANGFIRFRMAISPNTAGYISIQSTEGLGINNYSPKGYHPETFMPVIKGQKFIVTYASGMTTVDFFRFYYAQGEPNL